MFEHLLRLTDRLKPGLAGLGRHDRGQLTDARSDVGSGRPQAADPLRVWSRPSTF